MAVAVVGILGYRAPLVLLAQNIAHVVVGVIQFRPVRFGLRQQLVPRVVVFDDHVPLVVGLRPLGLVVVPADLPKIVRNVAVDHDVRRCLLVVQVGRKAASGVFALNADGEPGDLVLCAAGEHPVGRFYQLLAGRGDCNRR